jgi:SAM-dependent methyltransferase
MLRSQGLGGLLTAVGRRLSRRTARCYTMCAPALRGARGLEIGGPTPMFRRGGLLPIYHLFDRVDNCNFSPSTIWEGTIDRGPTFRFDRHRPPGHQFIAEAVELRFAATGHYDALLSSHTLEHTANPLAALAEWTRVLRPGGTLVLVLPHHEGTFDHRRTVTTLDHLCDDRARGTGEDDRTHLPEVLALHDLARDPAAGSEQAFRARSARNLENRCLHHHVFDTLLVVRLLDAAQWRILAVEPVRPYHIIAIAESPTGSQRPDNGLVLGPGAPWLRSSPFSRDRMERGAPVPRAD